MSFGFDCCCGCCGSSAFEWDANIGNYLTNETCTSCSNASGTIAFKKSTPNNFCDFSWAVSRNPGDPCNISVPITCNFPAPLNGLAIAICAGFANVSQDCSIGILGAWGTNGELHINENTRTLWGFKAQSSIGDSFNIVNDPSVSFTLNPCSMYLYLITLQQPNDLDQFGNLSLRYYNFTYYAKDNLTSQDFQRQIVLPQIYNFTAGSFGNMACSESSGILGHVGKPCDGANPPASITVTPVFN